MKIKANKVISTKKHRKMKKIALIIAAITLTLGSSAQIENLYSKDSTVCLNGVYAGALNLVNFDLDTLKASTFTDFRVGA